MADPKPEKTVLQQADAAEQEQETEDERSLYLRGGRTLATRASGADEVVEIRAASGQVELSIRITEDGPVLSLDGVKLQVSAAESIEMSCKTFRVDAAESVEVTSKGEVKLTAEKDATVESTADVRVHGKTIWLN